MNTSASPASGMPRKETDTPSLSTSNVASIRWLYALIGLMVMIHLSMATGRSINWDEFWFYSQVEVVARGDFIQPLQTIHTRFFFWLPGMPGSEIDHIMTARLFMLACLAITAGGIYAIAEKHSDHRTALLVTAAYLGAGFVIHHGTSFRVDPIVTALLTTALAVAARKKLTLTWIIVIGTLIGFAGMVTIKFVLWAPAFAGMALWRWQDEGWDVRYPLRWIAAGAVAIVVFAALYTLHSMHAGADMVNQSAAGTLSRSSNKMFGLFQSPYIFMMAKGALTAMPLAIALLLVPSTVLRLELPIWRRIALVAMWFPVLTPLYYHNSAPYVYVFLLPPVAATCAFTIPVLTRRYGFGLVAAFIALSAFAVWMVDERGVTKKQAQLIEAVHQIFPEPVHYFDCCGMVGTFPKANEFLTSWGTEKYLMTGRPQLLEKMHEVPVPLVVDNNENFSPLLENDNASRFHPADARALQENYVHFWGDIYLAGRELEANSTLQWNALVPGIYSVEGRLSINGESYGTGDLVTLDRGTQTLANESDESARLIWGARPRRPEGAAPELYWTGF
ncbi:MAG: hypothetical protein AAF941_05830 [Pseudomonadota bacterium]